MTCCCGDTNNKKGCKYLVGTDQRIYIYTFDLLGLNRVWVILNLFSIIKENLTPSNLVVKSQNLDITIVEYTICLRCPNFDRVGGELQSK